MFLLREEAVLPASSGRSEADYRIITLASLPTAASHMSLVSGGAVEAPISSMTHTEWTAAPTFKHLTMLLYPIEHCAQAPCHLDNGGVLTAPRDQPIV